MRPVSRLTMCVALGISWGSMLAHNLYELPLGPLDPENAGPSLVALGLGAAYAARPGSFAIASAAFAWGALNLVVGGIVTVLPLSFLPFVPEQSVSHHAAHVVSTLGQVPLVVVSYRAARWAAGRSRRSSDAPAR